MQVLRTGSKLVGHEGFAGAKHKPPTPALKPGRHVEVLKQVPATFVNPEGHEDVPSHVPKRFTKPPGHEASLVQIAPRFVQLPSGQDVVGTGTQTSSHKPNAQTSVHSCLVPIVESIVQVPAILLPVEQVDEPVQVPTFKCQRSGGRDYTRTRWRRSYDHCLFAAQYPAAGLSIKPTGSTRISEPQPDFLTSPRIFSIVRMNSGTLIGLVM